jgi:RNA polymerase sigma-70 factor, ECF subfamily
VQGGGFYMGLQIMDVELYEVIENEELREIFLEQIIEEYSEPILWLSYTYVKDKQLAEEIMQDVFLTCYNKIETFQNKSSLKTWIYRIAINKCKDQLRKNKLKRLIFKEHIEETYDDTNYNHPESIVIQKHEGELLVKHVMSLPLKLKEIIYMHYFENMKIKEISEILNVNENTVKTRLSRGRYALKKMYEED